MNYSLILILLCLTAQQTQQKSAFQELLIQESSDSLDLFSQFSKMHQKNYMNDEEIFKSLQTFKNNQQTIFMHQIRDPKAQYGVTQFADISPEEFEEKYLNFPAHLINENNIPKKVEPVTFSIFDYIFGDEDRYKTDDLPLNFDWRDNITIPDAKQQGSCGGCWAFATTGILEAQYAKKYNKTINFSEQYLIDCDTRDYGCKGGLMTEAYQYLMKNGIVATDLYGKYKDRKEECHLQNLKSQYTNNLKQFKVTDYYQIAKDERAILRELYLNGPVAVGINGRFLQFYRGGIADPEGCDNKINHAVVIVGYGVGQDESGSETPYWILRNEWGSSWGEKGYYKLIRGKEKCGVHTYASMAFIE